MTKVALSGAGGQLGRFLRPALLEKGVDLRSAGGRSPLEPLRRRARTSCMAICARPRSSTGCSRAWTC